jgi:hypothetical protein
MGQRLYRDTERLIDEHPFTDTGDKRTSNQPPGADVMTLPAANRGPRRVQTLSDERIAELLEVACTAGAAAEAARQQMLTEADRRTAAIRQLHDAGLSVRWLAAALAVSPAVVAGILRRA